MAEYHLLDSSAGAGDIHSRVHASLVIIDTPTPYPTENSEDTTVQPTSPISGPPAEDLASVSDTPLRIWKLKPTRWAAGLIGPLREVKYEGQKGEELFVEFDSGFFRNKTAVIRDPSNNNAKPFGIVNSERMWKSGDVRIYAYNDAQKVEIGKIERVGCICQGLSKITLPHGAVYYMKNFVGMLSGFEVGTQFTTIFAQNFKPLIHWSQNSGLVSIYTHLDVTLMLLILARHTASYTLGGTQIVEPTLAQLDFVSRFLEHENHNKWHRTQRHLCPNDQLFRFAFSLPILLPSNIF